jgi:transposase
MRIVWLFSLVLGYSRLIWARFVAHQDLQTVLRCHMAAFAALGGVPRQILYDRMKTAVIGEDDRGPHRLQPRADRLCRPLWVPPQGLPPLPRQDEGESGAAIPLHP